MDNKQKILLVGLLLALVFLLVVFVAPSVVRSPTTTSMVENDVSTATVPAVSGSGAPTAQNTTGLKVPSEFRIEMIADRLSAPRDMSISQGGTLVVSEPQSGKIQAFRLSDKKKTTILSGLQRPHGVLFHNGKLFVAEEERLIRYAWDETNQKATKEKELFSLPKGGRHWSRTLAFDKNERLFVAIGSTCDVCVEKDERISTVLVSDAEGNNPRIFSKGLRNATFITLNPSTNQIWGSEMGRDFLGDTLPPDEVNILVEGKDYGWPYCYGDKVFDTKGAGKDAAFCQTTESPVYQIPAHSAPLGITFISSSHFPADWQGDILISYHGSWNSSVPVGYKVARLKVDGNRVTGAEDFITGFIDGKNVIARPVDLEFDPQGNLYLSDDKAGKMYKISKQ